MHMGFDVSGKSFLLNLSVKVGFAWEVRWGFENFETCVKSVQEVDFHPKDKFLGMH